MTALDIARLRVTGNLKKFSGFGVLSLRYYRAITVVVNPVLGIVERELRGIK